MNFSERCKTERGPLLVVVCAYLVFATLYFCGHSFHWFHGYFNAFKIMPLSLLAIMSLWMLPWQMGLAMLFAALGDLFGEMKHPGGSDIWFLLQIAFFALGHFMIIWWLLACAWRKRAEAIRKAKREAKKSTAAKHARPDNDGTYAALMMLPPVAVVFAACKYIIPFAGAPMNWFMVGYAAIIAVMWWCAAMQKDPVYILGATFFVCSDFILAWDIFVGDVSCGTYKIMILYYLAELLLFARSSDYYEKCVAGNEFWHRLRK